MLTRYFIYYYFRDNMTRAFHFSFFFDEKTTRQTLYSFLSAVDIFGLFGQH